MNCDLKEKMGYICKIEVSDCAVVIWIMFVERELRLFKKKTYCDW